MNATKNIANDKVAVKRLARRDWIVLLEDKVVSRVTSGELAYAVATDMLNEKKGRSRPRPVRCVETGTEFDSIAIAMDEMGASSIFSALASGETAGGFHWEYIEPDDKIRRLSGRSQHVKVKVQCVETGEVFSTITEAGKKYGVPIRSIRACLNGIQKTAGGLSWKEI